MAELVITQAEGSRGRLTLRGTAEHLQGAEWGVAQRGRTRWVTGSPLAAAGLSGPERTPTTFEFDWRNQSLGANPSLYEMRGQQTTLDTAEALVEYVERMVAESSRVTVSWRGRELVGVLRSLTPTELSPGRWDAELRIEWVDARSLLKTRTGVPNVDPRSSAARITRQFRSLINRATFPAAVAQGYLDEAQRNANDLGASVSVLNSVARSYRENGQTALRLRRTVSGSVSDVGGQSQSFIGAAARPLEEMTGSRTDATSLLQSVRARGVMGSQAVDIRSQAISDSVALDTERSNAVADVYTAAEGEYLYQVAKRFYGNPDLWGHLLSFNPDIDSARLTAGQQVRVPPLTELPA